MNRIALFSLLLLTACQIDTSRIRAMQRDGDASDGPVLTEQADASDSASPESAADSVETDTKTDTGQVPDVATEVVTIDDAADVPLPEDVLQAADDSLPDSPPDLGPCSDPSWERCDNGSCAPQSSSNSSCGACHPVSCPPPSQTSIGCDYNTQGHAVCCSVIQHTSSVPSCDPNPCPGGGRCYWGADPYSPGGYEIACCPAG